MLMMMMTIMLTRSREVESTSSELASALGKTVGHDDEEHHRQQDDDGGGLMMMIIIIKIPIPIQMMIA